MAENRLPETRDVWPRTLLFFGGGLLVFLALSVIVLGLVFNVVPHWPQPGRSAEGSKASPALQTRAEADLATFRRSQDKALATLGWVYRKAAIARIPIYDAMKIVAAKGLPNWSEPSSAEGECGLLKGQVPRAPQSASCANGNGGGQSP
jgi:hypothetical protein